MLGPQGGSLRPSRPASPHRSVCLPGEGRAAGPKAKSRHRAQGLRLTSTALPTSRRLRRLDASEAASPLSGKKSSVASNKLSADWLNAMGPRGDVLAPPHGGMRSRPCSPGACVFPLCGPPHTHTHQARDTVGGAVLSEAALLWILLDTQTTPFPSSQQAAPHSEVSGSCDFV